MLKFQIIGYFVISMKKDVILSPQAKDPETSALNTGFFTPPEVKVIRTLKLLFSINHYN